MLLRFHGGVMRFHGGVMGFGKPTSSISNKDVARGKSIYMEQPSSLPDPCIVEKSDHTLTLHINN